METPFHIFTGLYSNLLYSLDYTADLKIHKPVAGQSGREGVRCKRIQGRYGAATAWMSAQTAAMAQVWENFP